MVHHKSSSFSFGLSQWIKDIPQNDSIHSASQHYMPQTNTSSPAEEYNEPVRAVLYEEDYASIIYYPVLRTISIEWRAYCTSDQYKSVLEKTFQYAISRGCASWLTNLNRWVTINEEVKDWINEQFLSRFEASSLQNMGIMIDGNVFNYLHAEKLAVRLKEANFKVRFFLDKDIAYGWLAKNAQ